MRLFSHMASPGFSVDPCDQEIHVDWKNLLSNLCIEEFRRYTMARAVGNDRVVSADAACPLTRSRLKKRNKIVSAEVDKKDRHMKWLKEVSPYHERMQSIVKPHEAQCHG